MLGFIALLLAISQIGALCWSSSGAVPLGGCLGTIPLDGARS
jgi:hypothetical protein